MISLLAWVSLCARHRVGCVVHVISFNALGDLGTLWSQITTWRLKEVRIVGPGHMVTGARI